jgi:hypothetical protein
MNYSEDLSKMVSNIIGGYIDYMKFVINGLLFITSFWLLFIILYVFYCDVFFIII